MDTSKILVQTSKGENVCLSVNMLYTEMPYSVNHESPAGQAQCPPQWLMRSHILSLDSNLQNTSSLLTS